MLKNNYCWLMCVGIFFVTQGVCAGLRLQLKGGLHGRTEDTNEPVVVVAQGDEYVVQVTSDTDCRDSLVVHGVENAAAFAVSRGGVSNSMTIVNGHTTSSYVYNYTIQPLVVGSYKLGPAMAEGAAGQALSNTVLVRVVEPAAYDKFAGKKGAARQALQCSLVVDMHEVYVGQPLSLKVVIEDDGNVLERALQPPHFGALKAEPVGKISAEQKMVNGQSKMVTQQEYLVTADAPGTYTIEPATAHFIIPDDEHGAGMQGLFGAFFGPNGKKRLVKSNSMIIGVKPLPLSSDPVDGVGTFTAVSLRAQKTTVELNEPCTLLFSITGSGNFDSITAPMLESSDELSVYPSGSSMAQAGGSSMTKTFEYIAQIGVVGQYEIPAQSFTYFDTQSGVYKKLYTQPLIMQVKPAKKGNEQASVPTTEEKKVVVKPVVPTSSVPVLPWWLFLVIVSVLFIVIFRDILRGGLYQLGERLGITSPMKREKAVLVAIIAQQDVAQLHSFFIGVLARALNCNTQYMDLDLIEAQIRGWDWPFERIQLFLAYIEKCSQAAFAPYTLREVTKTELLDKALYWYELVCAELKGK